MSRRNLIPLRDPSEIPPNMTEQQARTFWDTHEVTEEYLERAGPVPDGTLPAAGVGTRTILVQVEAETLRRLKTLSRRDGVAPQELVRRALAEWLPMAEERIEREGERGAEQSSGRARRRSSSS